MTTFGGIDYDPGARQWVIDAVPHVRIRLKRIFPRVSTFATGELRLADTLEVCREIAWVIERWPMKLSKPVARRLEEGARAYDERAETVESILAGYRPPRDLIAPAREPRPYQLTAADLCATTGGLLCTDEIGLGKTFTGLLLLRDPAALPALVVCPTNLPRQWVREQVKSFPDLLAHIVTSRTVYDPKVPDRDGEMRSPDLLIVPYSKIAAWGDFLAGQVRTVIFDEVQELRRTGTDKYQAAALVAHAADLRMGLSATPVYNYGDEMWAIMDVLQHDALGSWDEFRREWCSGDASGKQKIVYPAAFGEYVRSEGIMLRRTRIDVSAEIPGGGEPLRIPHEIALDEHTLDALTADAEEIALTILSSDETLTNTERWRAAGDFDWKLRHATGVAKAPYVAQFVAMLLEAGQPVVLFGWHREVYDIWAEKLARFKPAFYTGSESPNQKAESERRFLDGETDLLVMSLRSGAGLDGLQARTNVVVFGELDWSPGMHIQCIGRVWRDGQQQEVVAYFLVADSGSDPVVIDVLEIKTQQAEPILNPDADLFQSYAQTDRVKLLAEDFLRRRGRLP